MNTDKHDYEFIKNDLLENGTSEQRKMILFFTRKFPFNKRNEPIKNYIDGLIERGVIEG